MSPERWERIRKIYHSALEVEPARRKAFVRENCAGDESLFTELTSLLAQEGNSDGFFDSPALEVAARELAEEGPGKPQQSLAGQTISHYRIEKKIGEGGMGEVFLARDTSLHRDVALKFLPPAMQRDPAAHKRFLSEARSAAALDSPYICSIHEVCEIEGIAFIVMEHVAGQTLADRLRRGSLPLNQALQIATEVAEAVQTAHDRRIVHRDLKPSNIMLTKTGRAKVMDFGLAKQIAPSDGIDAPEKSVSTLTHTGITLGTLAYMSPEQVRGEAVDARSDIFSFGVVLYELLTGAHPFRKETSIETAAAILREEAKPAGTLTRGIPVDLEKLIARCLRKNLERRFQHIGDVRISLLEMKEDLDAGRPQTASPAPRRSRLLLATVVVLAGLFAAGWYWLTRERSVEPDTPLATMPLTSYPGYEDIPSFSPDGNFVAFQWCGEAPGADCDIWVKQIGVEPPLQLTRDPAVDFSPAWSPDGLYIAFLRQLSQNNSAVIIVPRTGGQEQVKGESGTIQTDLGTLMRCLAWTRDSRWLVIGSSESNSADGSLSLM